MSRCRENSEAVRNLIREIGVHRDVYIDEEVFQLEMEHPFTPTWADVSHDRQVPHPGRKVAGGNLNIRLNGVDIVNCDDAFGNV